VTAAELPLNVITTNESEFTALTERKLRVENNYKQPINN